MDGCESVSIESTHTKTNSKKVFIIYFEKQSKLVSDNINDERQFQNTANPRWNDAFSKYFFQENVQTQMVRVVRRLNVTKKQQFQRHKIVNNHFQ